MAASEASLIRKSGARWLALAAALVLAGCTPALDLGPTAPAASTTTTAAPVAHAAIVEAYGGIYRNNQLERSLARIVGKLIAATDDPDQPYSITILNTSAINAFAIPGGYLYVTRGLITLANDSSEIAAVIAHEMGHILADHATERRNEALAEAILADTVAEAVQDPAAAQAAVTASQGTLAAFSRQQELDADAIGIGILARAGYDPYAAARFLSRMSQFQAYRASIGVRQDQQPDFLATHPSNQDRINAAATVAQQYGPPDTGATDRDEYLAGLDGVVFGDDADQGYIRGHTFYHAGLGIAFAVAEDYTLDNTHEAVLATAGDGTALRFDAVGVPPGQSLTDYLRSGWVNGLDAASVTSLTINGLPAASASATAAGWYFRITVISVGSATYRFIFASDRNSAAFGQVAAAIAGSFRQLNAQEIANLRPLQIAIVTVRNGDTIETLAQQMRGVDQPTQLLMILNGIEPGTVPAPGSHIKIVTD